MIVVIAAAEIDETAETEICICTLNKLSCVAPVFVSPFASIGTKMERSFHPH